MHVTADYQMFSQSRRPKGLQRTWGGITTIVRRKLKPQCRHNLCTPDVLVLQIGNLLVFNVYILPETTSWEGVIESDPWLSLANVLCRVAASAADVILVGDFNARTASHSASFLDPKRFSADATFFTRGTALLKLLDECACTILNGIPELEPTSASFTSFQPRGNAVVDYAICSRRLLWSIRGLFLDRSTPVDHIPLSVALQLQCDFVNSAIYRHNRLDPLSLPDVSDLDQDYIPLIKAASDNNSKVEALYGLVFYHTAPVRAAIDGACSHNGTLVAATGTGVYWGPKAVRNLAARVPGEQTNNRAELFALRELLRMADTVKLLWVWCDSRFVINGVTQYALQNSNLNWSCKHGDLFKDVFTLLRSRTAPLHLEYMKSHSGHVFNECELSWEPSQ